MAIRASGYDVLSAAGHPVVYHRYTGESVLSDEDRARGIQPTPTFEKRSMRMIINFMPRPSLQEAAGRIRSESVRFTAPIEMGENDEVEYLGRRYRIEAPAEPSAISGFWSAMGMRT